MKRGRLYVVSAPSGAGKTSLVKALMEREPAIQFSVSYTTRKPRTNEVPGRDYHFVDPERFDQMAADGEFLEHARVFDNCYGTGVRAVEEALRNGEQLLLEIDWQGARQVRARLPEACSIFILPPSRGALEERLKNRSTDSQSVIERRLRDAAQDIGHWNEFDYVVINDQFERAILDLQNIVHDRGAGLAATNPQDRAIRRPIGRFVKSRRGGWLAAKSASLLCWQSLYRNPKYGAYHSRRLPSE